MGKGIDYGRGQTNIDKATGIRFGVIPQAEVLQAWADSSEPDYGEPTCPKCGNEAIEASSDDLPEESEDWEHDKYECEDYACPDCKYIFGSESAFGDEPNGFTYDSDGYLCESDSDGVDIFILKSPFYTRAAFCSPCAPGACYLRNPCDDGERAYCFGHDWFDDGKAPYPVYRVSDDSPVLPAE